ncbi:porin family protein [Agitococcus lubricus]|uniref:Tetratricopeptide repeat protein n=1 Tax=Agitococcus lubricus TaxID=1077255 RepID=A0A2T5IY23_9GAMM|nr:porin family protein [Agitococcus lubricus]PTQ88881.1 tetratricopeptide repeat protein [Agitococcus lubricus]
MRFQALFFALMLATTPTLADDVLQQADTLIRQQQALQAYNLLAPLEDERAGDPKYDYLLGLSLLESGDPSSAIFAFERCLTIEPNNGPCRVQIARTHLAIGETPNARAELQTIQEYNPPAEVQALVSQFLGTINTIEKQQKRQITAYVQVGGGYDSNINNAPADAEKTAAALPPILGLFKISASSISTAEEASFANINAGAGVQYKVNPKLTALADIALQNRSYIDHNESNYQSADISTGAAYSVNRSQWIGKINYQNMWLDSENYRDVVGLLGQYQYALSDLSQLSAYGQYNQIRFDQLSARDADRMTLGIAYSRALEWQYTPVFYTSVYGGSENTKDSAADQYSQDFAGLRAGGALQFNKHCKLTVGLSVEQRDFQANFGLFNMPREETQYDISIGSAYKMANRFSLQPTYTYSRNDSNIALIDSTRHVVALDLRIDL